MTYSAEKVREIIDQKYKVRGVADELGVTRSYVYQIMRGERPINDDLARRLADVLHVDLDSIREDELVSQ